MEYTTSAIVSLTFMRSNIFFSRHVETKAAYEASRPTESTYKVDETDEVFNTLPTDSEDEGNIYIFSELLKVIKIQSLF